MNLTSFLMLIAVAFPAPEKLRAQNRDRLKPVFLCILIFNSAKTIF